MKIAIVISQFNEKINLGLLQGAIAALEEKKVEFDKDEDLFYAPGAFEIPLIAKALAKTGMFSGVVCLGSVIKGETAHFEYISEAAAHGIMQACLETETPITFGILTVYNEEQAIARSKLDAENKGREAALACIGAIRILDSIGSDLTVV